MLRKFTKKRALVVASIAVVAVAAVAFAFWSSTGSGTGEASAADPAVETVTIAQTSTISNLYPGGPAQTLSGTVENDSTENSVHVGSVTATIDGTSDEVNCPTTNFALGGTAVVDDELEPSGATGDSANWTGLTIDLVDAAGDGCKGVTVDLTYESD
jgi:hypothetical protein